MLSAFQVLGNWLLAVGVGLAVVACAGTGGIASDDPGKVVSERAQKRWQLVAEGRLDEAYEFLSPASRATVPVERFRKQTSGGKYWRTMSLDKIDCGGDTCRVRMILEYDIKEIKGLKATIEETWIKDAGTWWMVAAK